MLNRSRHRRHLHGLLVLYGRPKASRGRLRPRQLPDRLLRGVLRAHFKTWYDRCGVSVKRTVSYVGFLQFGSTLVSLRYPNVGFECALSAWNRDSRKFISKILYSHAPIPRNA